MFQAPSPNGPQENIDESDIRLGHELEHDDRGRHRDDPAGHDDALEKRHARQVLIHGQGQYQAEYQLQEHDDRGQQQGMEQGRPEDLIRSEPDKILQSHVIGRPLEQMGVGEGDSQAVEERIYREYAHDGQGRKY